MRIRPSVLRATLALALLSQIAGAQDQPGLLSRFHKPPQPPTLTDIGRTIDHVQDGILDQGTVVIKHPDVWSQARMTKFRKEFEAQMKGQLGIFNDVLAARIARTDSAGFTSQTALGASLTPLAPGSAGGITGTPASITSERNSVFNTAVGLQPAGDAGLPALPSTTGATFSLLNATIPGSVPGDPKAPQDNTNLGLGLEPSIYLDERKQYIDHLHALRRENLSDDISDSAGYALYLMRLPVSIDPGDKTKRGFGAVVNVTASHDFGPKFLPATYRNLVINDVVDQLSPVVYELIRTGTGKKYRESLNQALHERAGGKATDAKKTYSMNERSQVERDPTFVGDPSTKSWFNDLRKILPRSKSRDGERVYPIAPSDVPRVFVEQNLMNLAYDTQVALGLEDGTRAHRVRATEVRSLLRQELETAFDVMEGRGAEGLPPLMDVESIESLASAIYNRKFEGPKGAFVDSEDELNDFYRLYESFTHRLPGNLRFRPVGVLCWAIAVDAGLLNRQIREDMKQTKGGEGGFACPDDVDNLHFYPPTPLPEAELAFEQYIKARWPMITFSLQPVTDEQNIADAFSRKRDLQLAVSFALASGRISFRQANTFNRQLQYEAETINLNRTVTAFAHGNDTFGWKFRPRYQTPPEESNVQALGNLLLRGGPGPDYQIKNSKLEAGQRELIAVVVMPSFVRGIRVDVANNWFHLDDPDDRKVHTARTLEQGRKINEIRQALARVCDAGLYRAEDIERIKIRLHQLEKMLPTQTEFVRVPYENTLGGFALFTQGTSALVPELSGFEGVDAYDPGRYNEVLVYGKHISIHETAVVVGGRSIPDTPPEYPIVLKDDGGKAITDAAIASKSPYALVDALGNPVGAGAGNTGPYLGDLGGYEILSREVMRVRIPPGAQAITKDGHDYLELYVGTPNGISNHVLIPVVEAKVAAPAPPRGTFLMKTPSVTIAYKIAPEIDGSIRTLAFNDRNTTPKSVDIQLAAPGPLNPATIDVSFVLDDSRGIHRELSVTSNPFQSDSSTYSIPVEKIADIMKQVAVELYSPDPKPKSITVTLLVKSVLSPFGGPTDKPLAITVEYDPSPAEPNQKSNVAPPNPPAPAGPKGEGVQFQAPPSLEALPRTMRDDRELDPMARTTSLRPSAAASFQLPSPGLAVPGPTNPLPGATSFLGSPPRIPQLPTLPTQTIVVMPGARPAPNNITVSVPVQNPMPTPKHRGLLNRDKNATPANPTRPPLMERLRERIAP